MLFAALMLFAQASGPPASMSACWNGQCLTEAIPRAPAIVFFANRKASLSPTDLDFLDEFARQWQWWPHLTVQICSSPEGPKVRDIKLQRTRVSFLRDRLRSHGWKRIVVASHGRSCEIVGGPDRATGMNAVSLDFDLPGD